MKSWGSEMDGERRGKGLRFEQRLGRGRRGSTGAGAGAGHNARDRGDDERPCRGNTR